MSDGGVDVSCRKGEGYNNLLYLQRIISANATRVK